MTLTKDIKQLLLRRSRPQSYHITSTSKIPVWLVNRVSIPYIPAESSGRNHLAVQQRHLYCIHTAGKGRLARFFCFHLPSLPLFSTRSPYLIETKCAKITVAGICCPPTEGMLKGNKAGLHHQLPGCSQVFPQGLRTAPEASGDQVGIVNML